MLTTYVYNSIILEFALELYNTLITTKCSKYVWDYGNNVTSKLIHKISCIHGVTESQEIEYQK